MLTFRLSIIGSVGKPADSFGDLIPGGFGAATRPVAATVEIQPEEAASVLAPLTLEDKRRENFAKGDNIPKNVLFFSAGIVRSYLLWLGSSGGRGYFNGKLRGF